MQVSLAEETMCDPHNLFSFFGTQVDLVRRDYNLPGKKYQSLVMFLALTPDSNKKQVQTNPSPVCLVLPTYLGYTFDLHWLPACLNKS